VLSEFKVPTYTSYKMHVKPLEIKYKWEKPKATDSLRVNEDLLKENNFGLRFF
jgi:hypothetical protein